MTIEWKKPENIERLLVCLYAYLAEKNLKIDKRRIAELFGGEATMWAVEYGFRLIRNEAEKLNNGESSTGPAKAASTPITPKKTKTPRKDTASSGVATGRVSKTSTSSKNRAVAIKQEEIDSPTPPSLGSGTPASDGFETQLTEPLVDEDQTQRFTGSFEMGFEHLSMAEYAGFSTGYYDHVV